MTNPEKRIVIEHLKKSPDHLEHTAIRKGSDAFLVSTVNHGVGVLPIETFTFRINSVVAEGREGKPVYNDPKRIVPILGFSWQFQAGEEDTARDYHTRVVDSVADLLESDREQLVWMEGEALRD